MKENREFIDKFFVNIVNEVNEIFKKDYLSDAHSCEAV